MKLVGESDLSLPVLSRGKVRDIYDLKDKLLIIATDRISAFDFILPTLIPDKGRVLTQISIFWFDYLKDIIPNHFITGDISEIVKAAGIKNGAGQLEGRSMLVKKAKRVDVECVVRGYISGSAWKEYKQKKQVSGISFKSELKESDRFPEPVFTPSTKADTGHDENITEKQMIDIIGAPLTKKIKEASMALYLKAGKYALDKGIIIADTKFEFGLLDDELILIDEVFTPDSSRFWDKSRYKPGTSQASFDKQFVRDYLESIKWNKQPPVPALPEDIVEKTREKYLEALKRIARS